MRVIAGSARGVPLVVPRGTLVRPTSGRVRTSLFSILGDLVVGARVADLFAGSGALGIEALSRGAAFCCFVENARPALAALEANLANTRLAERAEIVRADAFAALPLVEARAPFDLILADPPYRMMLGGKGGVLDLLGCLASGAALGARGILIVQHDARAHLPDVVGPLTVTDRREYGGTTLTLLERADAASCPAAHTTGG